MNHEKSGAVSKSTSVVEYSLKGRHVALLVRKNHIDA